MTDHDRWYLEEELNDGSVIHTHLASHGRSYSTSGSIPSNPGWVNDSDALFDTSIYMRVDVADHRHWFDAYLKARFNHGHMRQLMQRHEPLRFDGE